TAGAVGLSAATMRSCSWSLLPFRQATGTCNVPRPSAQADTLPASTLSDSTETGGGTVSGAVGGGVGGAGGAVAAELGGGGEGGGVALGRAAAVGAALAAEAL